MAQNAAVARQSRVDSLVGEAIDNGLDNLADIKAHVASGLGDCEDAKSVFLGKFQRPFAGSGEWKRNLEQRVGAEPRGTWAISVGSNGASPIYEAVMSAGSGVTAVGCHYDVYDVEPNYAEVHGRMLGYEVYCAHRDAIQRRIVESNLASVDEYGIAVGKTFGPVTVNGNTLSSGVVTGVLPDGSVTAQCKKRGSPRAYRLTIGATTLAIKADLEPVVAPATP